MRRLSTQRCPAHGLLRLLALLLLTSLVAYGQSLGDVARENREKKAATASTTPPKVITNADLPKDPDGDSSPSADEAQTAPSPESAAASRKAAEQRAAEQRAAEHWKNKILEQKSTMANLQARINSLKASIQFVDPNAAYDYSSGLAYNRRQARLVERLKLLELQFGQQKQKLEDMQEAARKAGMHTAVYDP